MVDCELPLVAQLLLLESSADHINKSLFSYNGSELYGGSIACVVLHCPRSNRPLYSVLGRELLSQV